MYAGAEDGTEITDGVTISEGSIELTVAADLLRLSFSPQLLKLRQIPIAEIGTICQSADIYYQVMMTVVLKMMTAIVMPRIFKRRPSSSGEVLRLLLQTVKSRIFRVWRFRGRKPDKHRYYDANYACIGSSSRANIARLTSALLGSR